MISSATGIDPQTESRLNLGEKYLDLHDPIVMGILNVTPDSFSDGGRASSIPAAVERALRMFEEGASIVDIGGESTRPGSTSVSVEEEVQRVIPVLQAVRKESDGLISVDTTKAEVAKQSLSAGADVINDISAGTLDPEMIPLIAQESCGYVMMHMKGTPHDMQENPHYEDVVGEVRTFFSERIETCEDVGIDRGRLAIDPGIGFGKTVDHNVELLQNINRFSEFNVPILVGVSRKSFIEKIVKRGSAPDERVGGSLAAAVLAVSQGAKMIRAHDVRETVEALHIWRKLKQQA